MKALKSIVPHVLAVGLPIASLFVPALAQAKVVTETWYLQGPHNGADVKRVERAVRGLPGIASCEVTQATLEVRFDNEKLNDAELRNAVAHAGDYRLTQKVD